MGSAEVGLLMTYVRIDDEMHRNGKVRGVSLAARWSYIASICQSGNKLTDGFLADYDLSQVDADRKVAKELEGAGLWEPADGGWFVVGWGDVAKPGPRTWVHASRRAWDHLAKTLAPMVFDRDGHRCRQCKATEDLTVDHIIPLVRGGAHDEGNLQTLCRPCNSRKGAR